MTEHAATQGLEVDLRGVATAADADPAGYDVVVVGASLHKVHHQPDEIADWVKTHRPALDPLPTVFFSVLGLLARFVSLASTVVKSLAALRLLLT